MLLGSFVLGSTLLHRLVNSVTLTGLPAFLIYCIPLLCVIAYTTAREGEGFLKSLGRNTFWCYSFLILVATVAWFIGDV